MLPVNVQWFVCATVSVTRAVHPLCLVCRAPDREHQQGSEVLRVRLMSLADHFQTKRKDTATGTKDSSIHKQYMLNMQGFLSWLALMRHTCYKWFTVRLPNGQVRVSS